MPDSVLISLSISGLEVPGTTFLELFPGLATTSSTMQFQALQAGHLPR
jgi:hypothetical protein